MDCGTIEIDDKDSDCEINTQDSIIVIDDSEIVEDDLNLSEQKDENATLFQISFPCQNKYETLKECVISALKNELSQKKMQTDFHQNAENFQIHVMLKPFEECSALTEKKDNTEKKIFAIDTTPEIKNNKHVVPSYRRSIKEVLKEGQIAKSQEEYDNIKLNPKTNSCFNCNGNHNMKDCPKPRNVQKIRHNKKMFASKLERYHNDIEQRFGHLNPGQISNNLKSALGLRKGELPSFVYKMRVLGYPPGWLEDAKIAHSGLTLFDSEGRKVEESDEEGEIDVVKHKYDAEKILSFPGFNVDPGPNYTDDYKIYGVPPMLPIFSKEEFIKRLGDNVLKGYQRKKLKNLSANSSQNEVIPVDMDVDNDEGAMYSELSIRSSLPPDEPPPLPPSEDQNLNGTSDRSSPSLDELTALKQQLCEALSEKFEEPHNLTTEKEMSENTCSQQFQDSIVLDNEKYNIDRSLTPTGSRNTYIGTPVLKFSKYQKLPKGDAFSKGVSDVIYFENLPDSTGKYEDIKKVILKVRSAVSKLGNEN